MTDYRAWRVQEADGGFRGGVCELSTDDLPQGEVLVRVRYSSLNYKDALSASGNRGVTRSYPHTPGIDAAGEVAESAAEGFAPGDAVLVSGYDLGMNTPGGYGQYIRVPAAWVMPLPSGMDAREAMALGTAGLTAGLCVQALQERGNLQRGAPVAVTGASGGVGSLAVALLAKLGHPVTAYSRKPQAADLLHNLGAAAIADSADLAGDPPPIAAPQWGGAVDTLGGAPLAHLLAALQPGCAAACCGMVAGMQVPAGIFPFILRGAALLGVDSVEIPLDAKREVWQKLAGPWRLSEALERTTTEVGLGGLGDQVERILAGGMTGRVLVRLDD